MKFEDYFKVLKSNYAKKDNQDNICRALFDSVIIPLNLENDNGGLLDYTPGRLSEFINGKKPLPEKIRDNLYEEDVSSSIVSHFENEIVPKLLPDKNDLCHQIMLLVNADQSISAINKGTLRMLARPETVAAFLAETFRYAARGDSAVVATGSAKGEDSAPRSDLHLVGINNGDIGHDYFAIDTFSPIIGNSADERYHEIDSLFQKITDIHLPEHRPIATSGWLSITQNEPVIISDDEKDVLKQVAERRHIDIPEDFFNLGDLSRNPLKTINIISGGSNVEGSENARKKYRYFGKLLNVIDDALTRFHIESIFKDYRCIRLAVKNSGNCADQNVYVTLKVPKGAVKKPSELMSVDHQTLDDLLSDYDAYEFFGIKRSHNYLDYDSSVSKEISLSGYRPISNLPFSGSSRRTAEELEEDYSAIFDYYFDQDGDSMLITLEYDEIMHNTTVAFPTVLLLNNDFNTINYTIRSRNMPEVYSGSITLAD